MKTRSRKASRVLSADQCCHLTPTGRRCRSVRSGPNSALCKRHRAMEQVSHAADLAPDLAARLNDIRASLHSESGVRESLAELYILLAQNRVSARRAAVLAYISNLLLRLIPEPVKVVAPALPQRPLQKPPQKPPVRLILDMPAPARELEYQAEKDAAERQALQQAGAQSPSTQSPSPHGAL